VRPGPDEATVEVRGETNLLYQAVGRHFEPHNAEAQEKPVPEAAMGYDRARPSTADVLGAKATVRCGGKEPTYRVLVGLPVPPGRQRLVAADFARGRDGRWWFIEAGPGSCAGTAHEAVFSRDGKRLVSVTAFDATDLWVIESR
jgi:hypothetical protein